MCKTTCCLGSKCVYDLNTICNVAYLLQMAASNDASNLNSRCNHKAIVSSTDGHFFHAQEAFAVDEESSSASFHKLRGIFATLAKVPEGERITYSLTLRVLRCTITTSIIRRGFDTQMCRSVVVSPFDYAPGANHPAFLAL